MNKTTVSRKLNFLFYKTHPLIADCIPAQFVLLHYYRKYLSWHQTEATNHRCHNEFKIHYVRQWNKIHTTQLNITDGESKILYWNAPMTWSRWFLKFHYHVVNIHDIMNHEPQFKLTTVNRIFKYNISHIKKII